jgi:6-phosphogluconolactonase (cycloisomerase 2 family)
VLAVGCGGKGSGGGRFGGGGGSSSSTYLLSTDATAATLNLASISSSGSLTAVNTPAQTGVQPIAVAMTPDGKFAYVLNANSSTVSQFAVATDGTLTQPASAIGTGLQPTAIAVDPQERFAVVANTNSGAGATLSVFSINTTTGVLATAAAPIPLNVGDPKTLAVSGNEIYIADANTIDILIFSPATGTFAFATGSPFSAGAASTNISALYSPPQASTVLYATDTTTNQILSFTLSNSGLTATGSLSTGTQPVSPTADNQNRFLFVANQGSDSISVFSVDPTTGALAPITTMALAAGAAPNLLAYDPVNNFLLISESGKNQVLALAVNTSTGGLSPLAGPLSVTRAPSGLAVAKP